MFETAYIVEAYRERCEDYVEVIAKDDRTLIVVADGAGGTGDGHVAAQAVLRETRDNYDDIDSATGWAQFLSQLDFRIPAGETTAVIVDIRSEGILGASVGDSCAWVIEGPEITDLTRTQIRKPLLGSQQARPAPFWHGPLAGVLLVGSDGFGAYAGRDRIPPLIGRTNFFAIPRACVDLVRLPSGELWDDTAVVACRARRSGTSRQRYSI